jgi:hypothetical protein
MINPSFYESLKEILDQKAAGLSDFNFHDASDMFDGVARQVFTDQKSGFPMRVYKSYS